MSGAEKENEVPSTNANGKRVNALELGPRKKSYVVLLRIRCPYTIIPTNFYKFQVRSPGASWSAFLPHHTRHVQYPCFANTEHCSCS
jgi:hypothetical protein